jgi:hypothetical protein
MATVPPQNRRPSAIDIDEAIAAKLAEFDAVPKAVRDAAAAVAAIVRTLSAAGALRVLAFARRVQSAERRQMD